MKKTLLALYAVLLVLGLIAGGEAWADDGLQRPAAGSDTIFTPEELDDLLGPVALYPDPLLAQILPAATFVEQIDGAARYVRQYGSSARIDDQPWDVSVRAVAHYPDVLFMMDQKYDWTVSLGQAYLTQPDEVMDAIQRLRAEAQEEGNLASTPQQEVIDEDDDIRIVPAQPDVIYVPQYDPMVVYAEPSSPAYGFITFSIGFTIGAWLNRDCDWHRHRVYYHGWRGGGWIGRARPSINRRSTAYINSSNAVINVNPRVAQHDTARYREDLRQNAEYRRERSGQPAPRPATPVTAAPRHDDAGAYRGREPRGAQPAAQTGYGGYGSGRDAATYRERGQSSRENMRQVNRPQQSRSAPVQHPAAAGGRQSSPQSAPRQAAPAARSGGVQRR